MQCLTETTQGVFQVADPQPVDYTTCTYLIAQPSELQNELFNLTMEDAQILMPYFAIVLVTGFTYRAIAQALKTDERYDQNE